jgi:hypothetical protein
MAFADKSLALDVECAQASSALAEKEDAERLAQDLAAKGQKLADDKKVRSEA